jgi:hypothetical protein
VAKPPTPFSFITWDECFHSKYDRYCQELWEWSDHVDVLYLPKTPFTRLPWSADAPRYDTPDSGENRYRCPGTVSVWLLLAPHLEHYFSAGGDDTCEWEPIDAPLFWDDLGFILYPYTLFSECLTASDEPVSIEELLEELEIDFADDVLEACKNKSITMTFGLYCFLDYEYRGSPIFGKFCSGLVEYLGAFAGARRR